VKCQQPGCTGTIIDGYCNICGMPPDGAPAKSAMPAPPLSPPGGTVPAGGTAAAVIPIGDGKAGAKPAFVQGGPCQMPGCDGTIVDGYCDHCGSPAGSVANPAAAVAASAPSQIESTALGSARLGLRATPVRTAHTAASTAGRMGAGITTVPPEPRKDPEQAVLADPVVPEERRFCPTCEAPVGRSDENGPGRLEGYCSQCRQPYSFTPKLKPGDLVAHQYEVRGCLAHGGMGWIYLARDRNVSDRWVVLKGLLNVGDATAGAAAISEQRFLAQIEHPLIVEIYNFVTHNNAAYIVMEYVDGRSLKQILKDRTAANKGVYDPLPVDQALAYIYEILPAFSYLHDHGLLYCDFKPDNIIHVGDSVKLIDMGGVRHIDDDESPIFGTVGFQAPEVPLQGCSVASDIYTIGRTLLVCCAEFRGYQSTYETSLPPFEEIPLFAQYDSLYRLILKCCAPNPADRFTSIEELRLQLLGVLRQVVATATPGAARTSLPSPVFHPPVIASDSFTWKDLPALVTDPDDPLADWLAAVESMPFPDDRLDALLKPPLKSLDCLLALCRSAIEMKQKKILDETVAAILDDDPWEWRAVWMQGLSALQDARWGEAQASFNAVYGQIPGEIAPQFTLALACELAGDLTIAENLYQACASTDAAYITGAAFGLARTRSKRAARSTPKGKVDPILEALSMVPRTSGGWLESRRLMADLLVREGTSIADLQQAYQVTQGAGLDPKVQAQLDVKIYERALKFVVASGDPSLGAKMIGHVGLEKKWLRPAIERALRREAELESDDARRIDLIDRANTTRRWTFL
jgi:serine/threonine-protein kinase PknG